MYATNRNLLTLLALASVVAIPLTGGAHGSTDWELEPDAFAFSLADGETRTDTVTLHVPADATSPMVDVYLLADTTGSMGSPLASVKSGAAATVSALYTSLGATGIDLAIGAGNYKDFPSDAYAFDHQIAPVGSADAASVLSVISSWSASGGYDGPEGQLFALNRLANDADPAGGTIGWRDGAEKIVVWFGDAPGHDAVCAAISGLSEDITEASLTADLQDTGITVLAISTLSGYTGGLDANPRSGASNYLSACGAAGGASGQATRIAAATGGNHRTGVKSDELVTAIESLVTGAAETIGNVQLQVSGDIADYVIDLTPAAGYDDLDTTDEQDLLFDVTYGGACLDVETVVTGTLDAVADGALVASADVEITIPSCNTPPVALCDDVVVDADADCLGCASVDAGSVDPDGDAVTIEEYPTCDYELGDTVVELTITDPSGASDTCTGVVTVLDTTPPEVVVAEPLELWPPNHKYVSFDLSDCAAVADDNCDYDLLDVDTDGVITSISSDEVEDAAGNGDGKTTDDIVITGDSSFAVLAEREGTGNGRVYTVNFEVADLSGNVTEASCQVTVPHDMSGDVAVDDGAVYTVTR